MARPDPIRLVSSDVRDHNLGLVLSVLDDRGPMARAELAETTGLVRGAITTIVSDLIDLGLVRPASVAVPRGLGHVGRPLAALEVDGSRHSVLAVQFGLDEFLVGAVDLAGRVLLEESAAERTPFGDPEALVESLAARIRSACDRLDALGSPVLTLRVVAQAPVSSWSDTIWMAVNLGWHDVPLGEMLRARLPDFPLGLSIVNDAKMSTYAEWTALRGRYPERSLEDVLYLKSDTGIGGGAISRGEPLIARNGLAFEPGHQVVSRDGPKCLCGQFGCLEMLAGPDVVLEQAGLTSFAAANGVPSALTEFVRRVHASDERACAAWASAAGWIRMSISGLVMLLQPQIVVVGGYWGALAHDLTPEADTIREVLDLGGFGYRDAVLGSTIGRFSAVVGALTLARHELLRSPAALKASARELIQGLN